jgi:flagellar transcriptional activator FlhC
MCGLCHMPSRAGKTKKAKDAVVVAMSESALMPVAVSAPLAAVA